MKRLTILLLAAATLVSSAKASPKPSPETVAALAALDELHINAVAREMVPAAKRYRETLQKVERDAITSKDAAIAALTARELAKTEPGEFPLSLPESRSPLLPLLRTAAVEFEKQKDLAFQKVGAVTRAQLKKMIGELEAKSDFGSAEAVKIEFEAMGKVRLVILAASWGTSSKRVDVSSQIVSMLRFNRLETRADNRFGDPVPYWKKGLSVDFQIGNEKPRRWGVGEDAIMKIN